MRQLQCGDTTPDFSLPDHEGRVFQLAEQLKSGSVLLVFNLGFVWPHCTNHMAQLRHDYEQFQALNTEVAVIVPNGPRMIERYVNANTIPYPILTDQGSKVATQYAINLRNALVLTAMKPTVLLVDKSGKILYSNYTKSYIKEPDNREPLEVLRNLAR